MLYLLSVEGQIPHDHPLREVKALADEALAALSPLFDEMYAETGRPSVPPERLLKRRVTLGADRGYDTRAFVANCRERDVTPHVAQHQHHRRRSAIDRRTTCHSGYAASQRVRKRIEAIFGWMKTVGGLRRTRFLGIRRTQLAAHIVGAAYNLLRIAKLIRSTC